MFEPGYPCLSLGTHLFRLKGCEQRRSELFAKQGRGQQFTSGQERDVWIKKVRSSLQRWDHDPPPPPHPSSLPPPPQEAKSLSASIQGKDEQVCVGGMCGGMCVGVCVWGYVWGHVCVGYVCGGHVCVGYVCVGYVWGAYVWGACVWGGMCGGEIKVV